MTALTHEIVAEARKAAAVIDIGRLHAWPVPPAYDAAAKLAAALDKAAAPTAPPPMPTAAKDMPAWLRTVAAHRAAEKELAAVADDARARLAGDMIDAARGVCRDYVDRLAERFDTAAQRFTILLSDAPRTLTGTETPEQLALHSELLRVTTTLSVTAHQRLVVAQLVGENESLGRGAEAWLAVRVDHPGILVDHVTAAIRTLAGSLPTTLNQWAAVEPIGLALAGPNEAADRAEQYAAIANHAGRTAISPNAPRTWGDVLTALRQQTEQQPVPLPAA